MPGLKRVRVERPAVAYAYVWVTADTDEEALAEAAVTAEAQRPEYWRVDRVEGEARAVRVCAGGDE